MWCVVMAANGYPGEPQRGGEIRGLETAVSDPKVKIFHAGTARAGEQIITNGGRVLGVTAWGKDLRTARDAAYAAVEKIEFEGAQFRHDIGAKGLA